MQTVRLLFVLVSVLVSALAVPSWAEECVDADGNSIYAEPDVYQEMISTASSCYAASQLAIACAHGSSLDVRTAGLAYDKCEQELAAYGLASDDAALLATMNRRCTTRYASEDGTLYRSLEAYCHLDAVVWMLGIATP